MGGLGCVRAICVIRGDDPGPLALGPASQVQAYRRLAWDDFQRGWNGWGFYSYYALGGNPWNELDRSWIEGRPDYLMPLVLTLTAGEKKNVSGCKNREAAAP